MLNVAALVCVKNYGLCSMKSIKTLFVIIITSSLTGCFLPEYIKEAHNLSDELFVAGELKPNQLETEDHTLFYVSRPDNHKPAMVFIHGTPGDWRMFGPQFNDPQLVEAAHLVSIDRPGWGGSFDPEIGLITSFETQTEQIVPLLRDLKGESDRDVILVGHSLGATLAPYIAMQYPDLVDATVAIAGDLSNDHFRVQWYNKVATWWVVKWILPKELNWANDEVLAQPESLTFMESRWSSYDTPMLVIHGGKDTIVEPSNTEFASELKTASVVDVALYPEHGHLIHLSDPMTVNRHLLEVVTKTHVGLFNTSLAYEGGENPEDIVEQ